MSKYSIGFTCLQRLIFYSNVWGISFQPFPLTGIQAPPGGSGGGKAGREALTLFFPRSKEKKFDCAGAFQKKRQAKKGARCRGENVPCLKAHFSSRIIPIRPCKLIGTKRKTECGYKQAAEVSREKTVRSLLLSQEDEYTFRVDFLGEEGGGEDGMGGKSPGFFWYRTRKRLRWACLLVLPVGAWRGGGIPVTDVEFTCPDNRGSRLPPSSNRGIKRFSPIPRTKGRRWMGQDISDPEILGQEWFRRLLPPFPPLICIRTVIFFSNSNFTPFFSPFFVSNDKHCVSRRVTESQPVPPVVGCIRALEGSHDGSINGGVGG